MDGLPIRDGLVLDERELVERSARAGGPGGQHVDTSATKVELRFDVEGSTSLSAEHKAAVREALGSRLTNEGELVLHASEHRSRARNRDAARARLAALLADALAPRRPRRPTRRPRSAERRRLEAKKRRGQLKALRKPPPAT